MDQKCACGHLKGRHQTTNLGVVTHCADCGCQSFSEQAKCGVCGEPMPSGEEMFKYHGYSGPCPKPPLPRAAGKTHSDRADALRSEMCRLASWSRTPDEVAEALIAAVHADNGLLDEIAKAEVK